jgi:hypothetical protein
MEEKASTPNGGGVDTTSRGTGSTERNGNGYSLATLSTIKSIPNQSVEEVYSITSFFPLLLPSIHLPLLLLQSTDADSG